MSAPAQGNRISGAVGFSLGLLIRWTWRVIRPAPLLMLAALIADLVLTEARQFQTQLFANVLNRLTPSQLSGQASGAQGSASGSTGVLRALTPESLSNAAFLLIGLVTFLALFSFASRAIAAFADSRMLERLQLTLHDKLLSAGADWHDRHDTGASVQLVERIARGVQPILSLAAKYPLVQAIGLFTGAGLLSANLSQKALHVDWKIQAAGFALLLILPFGAWRLSNRVRASNMTLQAAERDVSTEILNSLSLPGDLQAIGAAPQRSRRMAERLHAVAKARFRMAVNSDLPTQLNQALPTIMQALFLAYAVLVVAKSPRPDPEAVGAIVAVYWLVPEVVNPLTSLIGFFTGLNAQWPMIQMFGEVLDSQPSIRDRVDAGAWPQNGTDLKLDNLSFSYLPGAKPILQGVDHAFEPGKITAIVGRSGSGKSTIIQLLTRRREPTAGTIRIGGLPLDQIKLEQISQNIGIVGQRALFISDTVRANFKLADANATDAEIESICRQTGFWDILLSKQSDAPLDLGMSRDGGPFSGGQGRIFAVTRALLRRPSIMLLDEPTAGINDLQLEEIAVQLRRACRGVTTIVVEHHGEFILGLADQICALDGGRFAQVGDPHMLAQEPGVFHDMLEARRRLAAGVGASITSQSFPPPTLEPKSAAAPVNARVGTVLTGWPA